MAEPKLNPVPGSGVSASKLKILRVFRPQICIPHPQWWYPQTPHLSPFCDLELSAPFPMPGVGRGQLGPEKTLGVSKGAERFLPSQDQAGLAGSELRTHMHTDMYMFLSLDYWCGQRALGLSRGHSTLAMASSVGWSYSSCLTSGLLLLGPPFCYQVTTRVQPKRDPGHGPQGLHSRRSGGNSKPKKPPKTPIVILLTPTFSIP